MFDDFFGLPLHPLLVHLTVVVIPVAATVAVVYALRPGWRWLLRWPLVVLAVTAPVAAFVTARAGKALAADLRLQQEIATHEDRGDLLVIYMAGFGLVALAASWLLGGPSALASGKGAREAVGAPALRWALGALLVAASVLVIVQVVLTGDAGSRAVWAAQP